MLVCRTPACRWRLVALLSLLALAATTSALPAVAAQDAGPDASSGDAAAEAGDARPEGASGEAEALESEAKEARRELSSLVAFRAGRLGPVQSPDLFRVDLRNDEAVRKRLAEIHKARADAAKRAPTHATRPAARALDAGADGADAAAEEDARDRALLDAETTGETLGLMRARSLELRELVLGLPRPLREELLAAEQTALRAEEARLERQKAEREAEQAEVERQRALQEAQRARSDVERRIAEARARIQEVRAEQIRARADLADRRIALDAAKEERDAFLGEAQRSFKDVAPGSSQADALYDGLVAQLVSLRKAATTLLDDVEGRAPAPAPSRELALPDTAGTDLGSERDKLREDHAGLLRDAESLDRENREATWAAVRSVMDAERRLNALRIDLLEKLSADKRDGVLGLGEEGLAQGAREIARIRLEARWLRASGGESLRDTLAELRKPAAVVRMAFEVLGLVALVWATAFARRRYARWLGAVRGVAARSFRRPSFLRAVQRATQALEAVGKEALTLGAVLLVALMPGIDVRHGPLSIVYALFLWYWLYRLAIAVTHRGLAWGASRGGVVSAATGDKLLRSVRLVMRSGFFVAVLLASAAAIVGHGYLYSVVVRAAWVLALPIALILVRRWRDDIAEAYLKLRPSGALSRAVGRTRERWVGFFVVIAAFGVVFAAGVVRALRRFVLGFDQSRKALAYLFRRRLEKQVEHAPSTVPLLDSKLLSFFSERAVADDQLAVPRYPNLDDLEARFVGWGEGERVGATLLVGRTGYGKTSWLAAARARLARGNPCAIALRDRATTSAGVVAALAPALGAPEGTKTEDELVSFLRAGPRRVVTVDDAQLIFLRGVDTLEGWESFTRVLERTAESVMWVVAFAHYPWEFARWTSTAGEVFRFEVELPPWSEAEIAELLEHRTRASELEITYDDLLMEAIEGADVSAQLLSTARDYNRLVWDYAEGSPRVALHVWGRSLAPDGEGHARVRLFRGPDAAVLEALSESTKFVLAAIVWHERLSLDEAAFVLQASRPACEDAFARFLEHGITEPHEGRSRISARWWPMVVRYLRRKHLIET